jgi:hypothetical protein
MCFTAVIIKHIVPFRNSQPFFDPESVGQHFQKIVAMNAQVFRNNILSDDKPLQPQGLKGSGASCQ